MKQPSAEQPPKVDENAMYKYKPIFKLPKYQIKYMETIYEGFEDFSFNEVNYEVTQKDLRFIEQSKSQGQLVTLTAQDFEKVVDVFEKFVFLGES